MLTKKKKYFPGNDSFSGVNEPEISREEEAGSEREKEREKVVEREMGREEERIGVFFLLFLTGVQERRDKIGDCSGNR